MRVTDAKVLKTPMTPVTQPIGVGEGIVSIDAVAGKLPRIAILHTWIDTQTEGWWRMALDIVGVKYDYISTQTVARTRSLRAKYDVILFGPIGGATTQRIVDGLPMWGNPTPWKATALTPNLGKIDATDDTRPGLGAQGVDVLKQFVRDGGLLITSEDTARFAIESGMAPGVSVTPPKDVRVVGSILQGIIVDRANPVVAGYANEQLPLYSAEGMSFTVSNLVTGDHGLPNGSDFERATGRGGPDDIDVPQGRAFVAPPALPDVKPWQPIPLNVEQSRNNPFVIPDQQKPRVIVRYGDAKQLLISGLLDNAKSIAEHAAVVDARYGNGHVLLFANNPLWRGETIGSYALVFNAITHFDQL